MLTDLFVRDLAIIERLEVAFGPSLNVVTGETGSGKSILIKALQLVLGGRGGADLVRHGTERAEVEALFRLPDALRKRLADAGLPDDEELVIRRTVAPSAEPGKPDARGTRSRATVNGHLTTLAQLKALASGLVDISSQHEHHSLADASSHLHYLDAFAHHDDLLDAVSISFRRARAAQRAVDELVAEAGGAQVDMWRWQAQELDRADPQPGELDALDEAIGKLEHVEALRSATSRAAEALRHRDRSIPQELARLEDDLLRAVAHDAALAPLAERIRGARAELEDVGDELARYTRRVGDDPRSIDALRERRRELIALCRKHATDLDGLLARRANLAERLDRVDRAEFHLERLRREAAAAAAAAAADAERLSAARTQAADRLGEAITRELADLGMGAARVQVAVGPVDGAGGVVVGDVRLTETGMDTVELLIAPNPGEPPRPLARVASGGELSRALLAIKRVLAGMGPVGSYVFDEVDTGVGGAVAESIAWKLAEVARHHQVLCITHLAPIAAFGDRHYVVAKRVDADRTHASIVRLPDDARVEELARMLGGRQITAATRSAAQELLVLAGASAASAVGSASRPSVSLGLVSHAVGSPAAAPPSL